MKKCILLMVIITCWIGLTAQENWELSYTNEAPAVPEQSFFQLGRDCIAGCDLDQDNNPEIIATNYKDHTVYVWEVTANNTFTLVWQSQPVPISSYASSPQAVAYGDLDNNGRSEIIFPVISTDVHTDESVPGFHVYEWNGVVGSDNYGTQPAAVFLPDSVDTYFRVHNFDIFDLDNDGQQELIWGNRPDNDHAFDAFIEVASVDGQWTGQHNYNIEFFRRTANDTLNAIPFAPVSGAIADCDGDNQPEYWIFGNGVYNSNTFVAALEATASNTYTCSEAVCWATDNDYALFNSMAQDFDDDGYDDLLVPQFKTPLLRMISAIDDAGAFQDSTQAPIWANFANNDEFNNIFRLVARNNHFYVADYYRIWEFSWQSNAADQFENWNYDCIYYEPADTLFGCGVTGGLAAPLVDLDADGNEELVLSYQLVSDSLNADNSHNIKSLRILERSAQNPAEWVRWQTASPTHQLSHYPNPFNPDVTISFSLAQQEATELTIFNVKGQRVTTLIRNTLPAGVHTIQWHGQNDNGQAVASGVYLYQLKTKSGIVTKKMMLLK